MVESLREIQKAGWVALEVNEEQSRHDMIERISEKKGRRASAHAGPLQAQRRQALTHLDQLIPRVAELPAEMPRGDLPGWVSDEILDLARLLSLPPQVTRWSEHARVMNAARVLLLPIWFVFRPVASPETLAKRQGWMKVGATRADDPTDVRAAIERLKTAAALLRGIRPVEQQG
jgi:hypothetical protein